MVLAPRSAGLVSSAQLSSSAKECLQAVAADHSKANESRLFEEGNEQGSETS